MSRPSLLDRNWKYTRAVETDIRKTFAKEKRRLREEAALKAALPESEGKVLRMRALERRR